MKPMLAHSFKNLGHQVKYPAFIQPKIDGHRCVATIKGGEAILTSRTEKPISMDSIKADLENAFGNIDIVLDGELWSPELTFEELSGIIRSKVRTKPLNKIYYTIFDVICEGTFEERIKLLEMAKILCEKTSNVGVLETLKVNNGNEVSEKFIELIEQGFEGAMLRTAYCKYASGKRSSQMLKIKEFDDDEFTVIDVAEGQGKMKGKAIFICVVSPPNALFRVKMKGKLSDLEYYYNHPEKAIGKKLTVQFQGYTQSGGPRFPIGIRFRED